MAISVKHFKNELDCDEPGFEVGVSYYSDYSVGASEICNGSGTITNVYGDFNNLGDIIANVGSVFNEGEADICLNGIDVVFNIDYTGSMNNAITGVRYGIVDITNKLALLSNNNYRVGVVLYDEKQSAGSYQYGDSDYYQNIPAAQKVEITTNAAYTQNIICPAKMTTVGNIAEVQSVMNAIGNASNTATTMRLGSGNGFPEPGGLATYEIVGNQIAGAWRADVLRLIIHVTDDAPGGDNDSYSAADATYFQNTLTPLLDANNVQFYHNNEGASSTAKQDTYEYLANNTTPAGAVYNGIDYAAQDSNGNYIWTNSIVSGIEDLCEITTVYTCDPAPAGWYAATPVVEGTTVCYYWNGSFWIDSYACPPPQYTIEIQYVDQITNGSVENIPLNHPNYGGNSTTWEFTGIAGSQHTATIGCDPDAGYNNLSVSVTNISDNSVITSTSVNSTTNEVTFTITMPSVDGTNETFTIGGSASQIIRTMTVNVINDIFDNSNGQSPTGSAKAVPQVPSAPLWTNAALDFGTPARRYEWTGVAGDVFIIDVDFNPIPVDYDLNMTGLTNTFEITQGGGTDITVTNSFNSMVFTPGATPSWAGSFTMPASDGWVEIRTNGTCTQPSYRYTLKASENIVGGEMAPGDEDTDFFGYTGDVFAHEVDVIPSSGYSSAATTNVQLDPNVESPVGANNGVTNLVNTGTGATMDLVMPAGGGIAGIVFGGAAQLQEYDYVINIADNSSHVNYGVITFTGIVGSPHSAVAVPMTDNNYTYTRDGFTILSESPSNSINVDWDQVNVSSLDLDISLDGGMPIGGGSANIVVELTSAPLQYDFNLDIQLSNPLLGSWVTSSIVVSGAAGDVITGSFIYNQDSEYTYTATGVTSNSASASGTLQSGDVPSTDYSITMPVGGGTGSLVVTDAAHTQNTYNYSLWYDNQNESGDGTVVVNPNPAVITAAAGVTVSWIMDLDPSPSYYDVSAGTLGAIVLHGGNLAIPAPELSLNTNVTNPDANAKIYGFLTMPSGGGTGYVAPKSACTSPDLNYVLNFTNNIPNTSLGANTHTFTGALGSVHSYTLDIIPQSNWTHEVTGITVTDNAGGNFTHTVDSNDDIDFALNGMPAGGVAGNLININGTSSPVTMTANIFYTDDSNEGDWDVPSITVTGATGDVIVVQNTWALATNNVVFDSLTTSHDSNGFTVSNETQTGRTYKFDLLMPSGGVNINVAGSINTSATTTVDPCIGTNCDGGSIWITRPTSTISAGEGQMIARCDGVINISIPQTCATSPGDLSFTLNNIPVSSTYVNNFGGNWNYTISDICSGIYTLKVYNTITGCEGVYPLQDVQYVSGDSPSTTTTEAPPQQYYYMTGGPCNGGPGSFYVYRATFPMHQFSIYETNNPTQPDTEILDSATGPLFDYTVIGPGTCDPDPDPGDPKGQI